jgi:hypothetical protein
MFAATVAAKTEMKAIEVCMLTNGSGLAESWRKLLEENGSGGESKS